MATKTRADLIAKTLGNLGVTSPGQPLADEDVSSVDDHVDTALATLSGKGVVTISDDNAIPLELFGPLADWLAEDAGPDFGKATDPKKMMLAEAEIRKIVYGRPTLEPLQVDYF
jgi:hypothetical protein